MDHWTLHKRRVAMQSARANRSLEVLRHVPGVGCREDGCWELLVGRKAPFCPTHLDKVSLSLTTPEGLPCVQRLSCGEGVEPPPIAPSPPRGFLGRTEPKESSDAEEEQEDTDKTLLRRRLEMHPSGMDHVELPPLYLRGCKEAGCAAVLVGASAFCPLHLDEHLSRGERVPVRVGSALDPEPDLRVGDIFRAAAAGDANMVVSFMQSGVDVNARLGGVTGPSALHLASSSGEERTAQVIVRAGGEVDALTAQSETPLHLAALSGCVGVVLVLLEEGFANPNCVNESKDTPLHLAAGGGHVAVVKELIIHGADAKAENEVGDTPFDVSLRDGHKEVTNYLTAVEMAQWTGALLSEG